jgi:hypothetical protein
MIDQKLTIDLRGVGNDIPTRLGKSRPTLTAPSPSAPPPEAIPPTVQGMGRA